MNVGGYKMTKTTATKAKIDKALQAAGFGEIEIARAEGCVYFANTDWIESSVMVPYYNSLTVEQWVEEAQALKAQHERLYG